MAESTEVSSATKMTITVKAPKEKHDIDIAANANVQRLKELVAVPFGIPADQVCLIFAGKILDSADLLEQHGIRHGLTVHLVIKTKSDEPIMTTPLLSGGRQPADISATPFGLGELGGLPGLDNLGMGSANFMDMQQRMQRELMSNPEMLRQMMENPFVQRMTSNPDLMRQLVMVNPQMRDLMERNPEITQMLNNHELMRQTMELARNPSMLQELFRPQDRPTTNLERGPGVNSSDGQSGESAGPNSTAASTAGSTATTTSTASNLGHNTMFNSAAMQSLSRQMMNNPQMIHNMIQAPYMQTMLHSLYDNPQLAQQIIGGNPLFCDNPQLLEQFTAQLPTMVSQLNNPDIQSAMTNPRAMDAVMQIQQGMQTLQSEAPNLFVGLSGLGGASTTPADTPTTTTPGSNPPSPAATTTETTDSQPAQPTATTAQPTASNPEMFTAMMSHLTSMMMGGQQAGQGGQRFSSQLEQLSTMGFVNTEDNVRALTATLGDVNAAIDRLLQRR